MQEAGIYEERFEFQIEETAELLDELKKAKEIIKKEGRVIEQTTYSNSLPTVKKVEHPLLSHYRSLHKDIPNHLASLGLNRLSEKKTDPKPNKNEKNPAKEWFGTI
jgi:hypothetical protein